jgi:hypothetical protein
MIIVRQAMSIIGWFVQYQAIGYYRSRVLYNPHIKYFAATAAALSWQQPQHRCS